VAVPFCCLYGNLHVSASLERCGYAPGEVILLRLDIREHEWEDVGEVCEGGG
jgi:hypothetical protein